jgi:Tol biopolymer transport system component
MSYWSAKCVTLRQWKRQSGRRKLDTLYLRPDGTRLAFASNRGGNWDIWTMKPDGSDAIRLTSDDGEDTHPAWSPDGRTVAFLSTRSGAREVWLMDADGGNQRPVK